MSTKGLQDQVEPMLAEIEKLPEALGKPEALLADTGYYSTGNVQACCDRKTNR